MNKKPSVEKTLGKLFEGEGWNTVEPSGSEETPYNDSPVVKDCGPVPTAQATEKPSFSNLATAMVDIPGAIQNGGDAVAKVHGSGECGGDECEKPISDVISASLTFEAPDMPPTEVGMEDEESGDSLEPLPEPEPEPEIEPEDTDIVPEDDFDSELPPSDEDEFPGEEFPEEDAEEGLDETPEDDAFEDLPEEGGEDIEGEEESPDRPVSDKLEDALKSESDEGADEDFPEDDKDKE